MSIPPDQPPREPDQPPHDSEQPHSPARERVKGVVAAMVAILLISALIGVVGGGGLAGFVSAPVVAFACVIVGSLLTISESRRPFAFGFLVTSAVLIFVTAGACLTALGRSASGA